MSQIVIGKRYFQYEDLGEEIFLLEDPFRLDEYGQAPLVIYKEEEDHSITIGMDGNVSPRWFYAINPDLNSPDVNDEQLDLAITEFAKNLREALKHEYPLYSVEIEW